MPHFCNAFLVLSMGAAGCWHGQVWSQEPAVGSLAYCAAIGPAADRLLCYDNLAGRAPSAPVSLASEPPSTESTSLLAPKDTPTSAVVQSTRQSGGVLSRYWELDGADKRGTFNLTGYKPNYAMPLRTTSRINRTPGSPTQATVSLPAYRKTEAQFQLSFRTKVVQDAGFEGGDVWLGFTQKTFWQVWNPIDSKPFRNTDYEPEISYVVPTPVQWRALPAGWQWRMVQVALAHQSNGQDDPLSRSWNRVYLGLGFERGNWTLLGRINHRLKEQLQDDNNPDLLNYRGRGELQLDWSPGRSAVSLEYQSTLDSLQSGSLRLDWTYPVFDDQPNGVRYIVQLFRGYGAGLTDYNFRQTSLGVGLSFMQF